MSKFKNYLTIILGAGIFAFAINYLIIPNHLYEGGATGVTLITYYLFKIPVSLMNLIINIPLFIIAWRIFGTRLLYSSILGTFAVSAWLAIFEKMMFTVDFCVLIFVILVFKDVRLVTYTLIFVFIASRVIDLIGEGGYAGKGFMVITSRPEELAKKIDEDLGRGITFINGQGYYSENDLKLIYCVVGRNEMQSMKKVIHSVDPHAFITITDAHEILGEGFTLDVNKQPIQK